MDVAVHDSPVQVFTTPPSAIGAVFVLYEKYWVALVAPESASAASQASEGALASETSRVVASGLDGELPPLEHVQLGEPHARSASPFTKGLPLESLVTTLAVMFPRTSLVPGVQVAMSSAANAAPVSNQA